MMVARSWEEGEMGNDCLMDRGFQFYKMKNIRKMDGGYRCTTLGIYSIPPEVIVKMANFVSP